MLGAQDLSLLEKRVRYRLQLLIEAVERTLDMAVEALLQLLLGARGHPRRYANDAAEELRDGIKVAATHRNFCASTRLDMSLHVAAHTNTATGTVARGRGR